MMFKKIFKHGSAYLLISLLTKFTGFLILPITTRYLSLDEYGLYTNIQTAQQLLYLFGTLSLDSAYGRFVYDYDGSRKKLRLLTSTIFTFFIVFNAIYLCISIGLLYFLMESWGRKEILIAFLVPFTILFQQFSALNISLMQSRLKTRKLLYITSTSYFTMQCLMLYMLVCLNLNVEALFLSQFFVGMVVVIIHIRLMVKEKIVIIFLFNKKTFKKMFRYGIGYMPASLSGWLFMMSDRYMITYYISLSMAGKYAFIVQITMIIQVIMQSIQTAQTPIFMKQMKDSSKESVKQIKNFFTVMIFSLLFIYLLMVMTLPYFIKILFSENYQGDYFLIPILAMGSLFLAIRKMFANVLVYYKKTMWISVSGYLPAVFNVTLNFIFIPEYGIYAAAWTTLISLILYAFIVFFMAQTLEKIDYDYVTISFLFTLILAFTLIGYYYGNFLLNFLFLVIFAFSGRFLGVYKILREGDDKKNF